MVLCASRFALWVDGFEVRIRGIFFMLFPSSILGAKKEGEKKEESSDGSGAGYNSSELHHSCRMQ